MFLPYSLFNAESPFCNTISARYYKDGSEILIDEFPSNEDFIDTKEKIEKI